MDENPSDPRSLEERLRDVDSFIASSISTPSASRLHRKIDQGRNLFVVQFIDRNILDEANIQQIRDELLRLIHSVKSPSLIIRFRNVDHLSSAALGVLYMIKREMNAVNGRLVLCEIDPQIYEVFRITKTDKYMTIVPSLADAERYLFPDAGEPTIPGPPVGPVTPG